VKICIFTENYYKGGLDTFLINLFNAWPESEDELLLFCNHKHPGLSTIKEKTSRPIHIVEYHRLFTSNVAQGHDSGKLRLLFITRVFYRVAFLLLQYPILFPWYVISLGYLFRRSDFERLLVVNGGYPASLLCRCALIAWRFAGNRSPAIFNFHNMAIKAPWYYGLIEYIIDLMVIKSASQIITVSKTCLASILKNRRAFLGCAKCSVIYNGIEDPTLGFEDVSKDSDNSSGRKHYCLMLATYENRKGHFYVLQAIKNVIRDFPQVQLLIYGDGKPVEKKRVADEVKRLSLEKNVSLNDFTTDTKSLFARASMVVVPSQAFESFGLTIIEAMAYGVPVVTTDVGGMPEVLGDSQAGYVSSKSNPIEFAAAIKLILGNPKLKEELGQNGRKTYEQKFMVNTMAGKYFRLFR